MQALASKVAHAIETTTGLQVDGNVYPATEFNTALAQLLSYVFFAGLLLMFLGETVFNHLNWPSGLQLVRMMKENQLASFGLLYLCNVFAGQLIQTGAFEVTFASCACTLACPTCC